ncbi:carbohydrate binding family 9 domain-containing protein [Aliikangiella maris]|uniref:DUF5916 domain-containing protein n=2 Tax=Aliikangiella maris TaxID=3162458 RepID=A0ABV3MI94_9GAMM
MIINQTASWLLRAVYVGTIGAILTILSFSCRSSELIGEIPFITLAPNKQIEIDGKLDETTWSDALELFLNFETSPGENIPAPVATRALIFEDGRNIYIAFEAYDDSPHLIRAYMGDRDSIESSDSVAIKLDTFNDSRKAFLFEVNPLGIQADSVIDEQSDKTDSSWDAIWFSAGKMTANGYNVEMKIPFAALRFENNRSKKRWGLELVRKLRRNVVHELTNLPVDRNIDCDLCQMGEVEGFALAESPSNLTLIPSLTLLQSDKRTFDNGLQWNNGKLRERLSLDMRWGINQNNFLNATLNPDFSQVEADSIQLDANNLSLLQLTEKRPFFLDGIDYFSNWTQLIYTRIFDEPEYGIKITGKEDKHSYGLISLKDKHTNLIIPNQYGANLFRLSDTESENQVVRYRYDLGDNSNIGATITLREADDYRNQVVGLDGRFWFTGSDYIKFQAMTSDTTYPYEFFVTTSEVTEKDISDQTVSFNYTHNDRDWGWFATYHRFGKDFRADAGFISVANWERSAFGFSRNWYSDEPSSWWKSVEIYGDWRETQEIDETPIDKGINLGIELNAIYESFFGFDIIDLENTYLGTTFETPSYIFWGGFNPIPELGIKFEYEWGDEIDYSAAVLGDVERLTLKLNYQLTQRLNSALEYIYEDFQYQNIDVYNTDIFNLKTTYQIDTNSFIRLTLQGKDSVDMDGKDKLLATQLIYSYKINPFTLFYAGYSDNYANQDERYPDLEKLNRSVFLKFSYAWQL